MFGGAGSAGHTTVSVCPLLDTSIGKRARAEKGSSGVCALRQRACAGTHALRCRPNAYAHYSHCVRTVLWLERVFSMRRGPEIREKYCEQECVRNNASSAAEITPHLSIPPPTAPIFYDHSRFEVSGRCHCLRRTNGLSLEFTPLSNCLTHIFSSLFCRL